MTKTCFFMFVLLADWVEQRDFKQNLSSPKPKEDQPFSLTIITPRTFPEFVIAWDVTRDEETTSRRVDSENFVQINSTLTFSQMKKNQKVQIISASVSREGRVEYTFVFKIPGKKLIKFKYI